MALSSINDGVIVTDTKGRVTFLNPIAQALTGWQLQDAIGKFLLPTAALQAEITARERASEVRRKSAEHFRAVAETANNAIISADSQGNIIFWNRSASQLFGYTAEEVYGEPLANPNSSAKPSSDGAP